MLILGITGGVATGKSTVTKVLAELGAPFISADALAREVLAPGTETTKSVLKMFPDCVDPTDPDGLTVDRQALGRLIFADLRARQRLEALTHPPVIAALTAQALRWRAQADICAGAMEIPLLFETRLQSLVDRVVVVICQAETQLSRLMARQNISGTEARRQIDSQWPLAQKRDAADVVITTDGTIADTHRRVLAFWQELCVKEAIAHV